MAKKYRAKMINVYELVKGNIAITSQMYKFKEPRKQFLNEKSLNSLRKKVVSLVTKTNKRLAKQVFDVNKGRYNPKTKRFERKGTITVIDEKGKRRKIRTTNIKDYRHTFASKKLEELESYNKKLNKIELTGNESKEELLQINKLTDNFLKSKTSTIEGIKEVEKNIKSNISAKLDEFDLTPSEVDALYTLYDDKDFTALRKYLDPSELQALMMEVKEYKEELADNKLINIDVEHEGFNKFKELFINYANLDSDSAGRDEDLQNSLIALYNKIDTIL